MNGDMDCERVRELAPDLAIGIADGQERDAALRHAATCPDCRRLVSELSTVVDDLLLLAPAHEPPSGFASRTVAALQAPPVARRRRWPTTPAIQHAPGSPWVARLAVAASFVLVLALGAGAVFLATSGDRRLANDYRAVLAQGHGSFFVAAAVRGTEGAVGTVFGYQGRPSWLFATVNLPDEGSGRFDVHLVTRDGRQLSLGSAVLGGIKTTWGDGIPVDLTEVAQLRFEGAGGQPTLVADLDARGPWSSG
jgi:hypothetical protein